MAVQNSKLLPSISNHSCSHGSDRSLIIRLFIFVLLFLMIPSSNSSAICQAPIPSPITSWEDTFGSYTDIKTYAVASGPVSNNLYYMFILTSPSSATVVRKTNSDGSTAWTAAISFQPLIKSLAINPVETYAYFGMNTNPLKVWKINSNTGDFSDIQEM